MTVDRELRPGSGTFMTGDDGKSEWPTPQEEPERPADRADGSDPVSRATVFWYTAVAAVLFSWFLFGWLVLKQGFIDSVGEALGTGFALLLVISVIGTVRRIRADR